MHGKRRATIRLLARLGAAAPPMKLGIIFYAKEVCGTFLDVPHYFAEMQVLGRFKSEMSKVCIA